MSDAAEKNAQALFALFGSHELVQRLLSVRIAVVTTPQSDTQAGRLLTEALADVLGRLWPQIDACGPLAELFLTGARSAAASGGVGIGGMIERWTPVYDCVVCIGCGSPVSTEHEIVIGADGWQVQLGSNAQCGSSDNPVGPAFAAALAAAQVFLRIFSTELADTGRLPLTECRFDVRAIARTGEIEVGPLDLGETHTFGVGAVTHGLCWLLERWPAPVTGTLNLVDADKYGTSNGQRYSGMSARDKSVVKVLAMSQRLEARHPGLRARPIEKDLNSYCAERGYEVDLERIVTGLDSPEARRHAGLKLPKRTVNMWTDGRHVGAGRYVPDVGSACLVCDYPEKLSDRKDETSMLAAQTGLRPDLIRALLDSPRSLSSDEAQDVARSKGVPVEALVGQPLRSILPMLCATGSIQFDGAKEAADVPFAFSSFFSGIAGFMMLLKDLGAHAGSEAWVQDVFAAPSELMHAVKPRREGCICCGTPYASESLGAS